MFVGHLHPFEVVLHLSGPVCVLLHAFDVLDRRPQYRAFIPAHVTMHTVEYTQAISIDKYQAVTDFIQDILSTLKIQHYKSNSQVIGFGDHCAQLFDTIIDVESPSPFNYEKKRKREM